MYATALALEDAAGQRAVLVTVDLHSGGRHLWRAAVDASGLAPARVLVSGSHTHAGPTQRYGGAMYTLPAGPSLVRPFTSSNRLAPLVGEAVRRSLQSLRPGGAAVARPVVADAGSNRAFPAWTQYGEHTRRQFLEEGPGSLLDPSLPLTDRCRDPRATVIIARSNDDSVRAVLAWYPVHGNALGLDYPQLGSDLWGYARSAASGDNWVVGLAAGSCGDVSPLPTTEGGLRRHDDPRRPSEQGPELARIVGRRIGSAIAEATGSAHPGPFTLAAAHERWRPHHRDLPRPMTGLAQVGAGLDGPTDLFDQVAAGVSAPLYQARRRRRYSMASGQGPKIPMIQGYLPLPLPLRLGVVWHLFAPQWVPLHVIRVGDHAIAAVPGEPTTMSGWRIEEAVRSASGCATASVAGLAGDYAGYWVTPEEYLEQRYEAAATIWGRRAAPALTERLAALATEVAVTR